MASRGQSLTVLLSDISQSVKLMEKIINDVGSETDTIEERRKFTALKTSVQTQIARATHKIHKDSKSKDYENEYLLQEYVNRFRRVIQLAVRQFRINKPFNPKLFQKHHSKYSSFDENISETKPLLMPNNPFNDEYQSQSQTMTTVQRRFDDDETKTLEENEEKMIYITEELTEMKDMFGDLDDIIRDQQDIVDLIANTVQESKDDVVNGATHLIKAEEKMKKIRCNRCICLLGLILLACTFLIYLWFTTLPHHK